MCHHFIISPIKNDFISQTGQKTSSINHSYNEKKKSSNNIIVQYKGLEEGLLVNFRLLPALKPRVYCLKGERDREREGEEREEGRNKEIERVEKKEADRVEKKEVERVENVSI